MKKFILVSILALFLLPYRLGAHNETVLPSAGLTPESSFYFLDRLGEVFQQFFTFNPEAKAHLQIAFAAERVAEIKIILETKGVDAKGLKVAQSRLQAHIANAAAIVIEQKSEGKDVSTLAKELGDELETPKSALADSFKAKKQALEAKEDDLKNQLKVARQAGDTAKEEALAQELGGVKAQKELLELKKEDIEDKLEAEEEKLERETEIKHKAEKAIRKAEEEKQEVLIEASEESVELPSAAFTKFDRLLAQAKELFAKENYEGSKQLAEQAKDSLEDIDKDVEKLEKEKERQEDRVKDDKKRAQEIKNDREEKVKEEVKKESENLKEDQKKVKEEETERSQTETVVVAPKTWTVEYKENQFVPSEIKIKKGDTVSWINKSGSSMWPASAFHPTHQVYPGFDALKSFGNGESYSFKFDQVGSWKYHNHVSASITGVVVVEE